MKDVKQQIVQAQVAKRKTLAEWRASRFHVMDLPSGLHVTVRDVTMTDLMLTGKLPASFIDMVQDAATKGGAMDMKEMAAHGEDFRVMLDALTEITLVEPLIGESDDSHIALFEIPNDDKMALFNFVNREVTATQSFREGQNEPVAVV